MRITFDNALNHIQFLATIFGRDRVRHVIVVLLLELNVPTDFDGFDYLVRGITIYNRDPSQMFGKDSTRQSRKPTPKRLKCRRSKVQSDVQLSQRGKTVML